MLGRVMESQLAGNAPSLGRRKRLVQRSRRTGVQVVHHQADAGGIGEVRVHECLQPAGKVDFGVRSRLKMHQ